MMYEEGFIVSVLRSYHNIEEIAREKGYTLKKED